MLLVLKLLWLFLNILLQMRITQVNCHELKHQNVNSKFKRSLQPIRNNSHISPPEEFPNLNFENDYAESEVDLTSLVESVTDTNLNDFALLEFIDNDRNLEDSFASDEFIAETTTAKLVLEPVYSDIIQKWLNERNGESGESQKSVEAELDFKYLEENLRLAKLQQALDGDVTKMPLEEPTTLAATVERISFENNGQILNLTVIDDSTESSILTTVAVASPAETSPTTAPLEQNLLVSNRYFFGNARDRNDVSCISLNLTVSIDHTDVPLNLGSNLVMNGGCDPLNAFIEFKWIGVENVGNLTINLGVICEEDLCYVNDLFANVYYLDGSKFYTEMKYTKIFVTEPGVVFESGVPVSLEMEGNFRVYLSDVRFFVSENLNERKACLEVSNINEYYSKLLGSIVGFLLIILFTTYLVFFVRKWRKANVDKKELTTT